jgi:hypothetical protein
MATDDGNTETFDGDSAGSDDAGSGVSVEPVQDVLARNTVDVVASDNEYWATLQVEYWWTPDGSTFNARTKCYKAKNNGRNKGDIDFRIRRPDSDPNWHRLTTEAHQDGNWHDLVSDASVSGNARTMLIDFHYIYDKSWGDPELWGSKTVEFTLSPPAITSPVNGGRVSPQFSISGAGVAGAEVVVFKSNSNSQIAPTAYVHGGLWTTTIFPAIDLGGLSFTARQRINNQNSDWAPAVQVTVELNPPVITSPINNSTGTELRPTFSGTGDNGAQVQIFRNGNTSMSDAVGVANDKTWSAALNQDLNWGPNTLTARQKMGAVSSDASSVTVTLLPHPPSITSPTADTQDRQFTVSGTNGVNGATVRIYLESNNSLVGTGQPNTTANWNVNVTVPPGPVSLVATQTINGAVSGLSGAQGFRIRPPKLTEPTVTYPLQDRAIFSGTGHPGATVDIVIESGPTGAEAPSSVTVNGAGTWETAQTVFPSGRYELKLIQKVSNHASGWIESEPLMHSVER